MAFNSDTYRANQYARKSAENLARARELKARVVAGELPAENWEAQRIGTFAKLAIIDARLSRSARRCAAIGKGEL
jgi:hypothetical protein